MNLRLKKEIVSHIFKTFGIWDNAQRMRLGTVEKLVHDDFLLDKRIAFEHDDKTRHYGYVWGACAKSGAASIKIMIADITDHNEPVEFASVVQMDNLSPYVLRLSESEEDIGAIAILAYDNWIEANTLTQAKLLVGIERLTEMMLKWEKLQDYQELYKCLIMYLNHNEE